MKKVYFVLLNFNLIKKKSDSHFNMIPYNNLNLIRILNHLELFHKMQTKNQFSNKCYINGVQIQFYFTKYCCIS